MRKCLVRAMPAILSGVLLMTTGASAEEHRWERTVSVSAAGTVSADPDTAAISTGVVSEAETAREALTRNTADMRKLVDGLKAQGIAEKDIQTTGLNVEPRYTQAKDGRPAVISGYRVSNQVRIIARDLTKLGAVLDEAVTLGANQMGAIQFEVSKAEELKDQARKTAMENALRRARLYAAGAGAELGQVLTIAEDMGGSGPRPPMPMARLAMAADVPIERGTQTLEVRVQVTWALK
jgi:uncharacterized protein